MPVPGSSAESEYRFRRGRRRRIRATVVFGALACGAGGTWTLWTGQAARVALVLWGLAVVAFFVSTRSWLGGRDVERWARGAAGERHTAHILAALPARRWAVRHDLAIPGSRANIDHVVIGRTGIWVIDSKTTGAPVRARWGRVYFADRRLSTDSVRWEAEVVEDRLAAVGANGAAGGSGGPVVLGSRLVEGPALVRPLVVVHGSGLRRRGGRAGGVRVVPAEMLIRRLKKGRRRLRRSEIAEVARALDEAFAAGRDGRVSAAGRSSRGGEGYPAGMGARPVTRASRVRG